MCIPPKCCFTPSRLHMNNSQQGQILNVLFVVLFFSIISKNKISHCHSCLSFITFEGQSLCNMWNSQSHEAAQSKAELEAQDLNYCCSQLRGLRPCLGALPEGGSPRHQTPAESLMRSSKAGLFFWLTNLYIQYLGASVLILSRWKLPSWIWFAFPPKF